MRDNIFYFIKQLALFWRVNMLRKKSLFIYVKLINLLQQLNIVVTIFAFIIIFLIIDFFLLRNWDHIVIRVYGINGRISESNTSRHTLQKSDR